MFGIKPKAGGLFGAGMQPGRAPYETPPIAGNMGAPGLGAQEQRKLGIGTRLFGRGWEDKAYALGGLLAGDGGAAVQQIKQARLAPLIAAQEREAEFAAWQRKQQWQRDNPAPHVNDTEADYNFWQSKLTPEQFEQWKANKINPPVWRQGADGQFYRMDTGGAASQPQTLGASLPQGWTIEGGPTPQASGPFPR